MDARTYMFLAFGFVVQVVTFSSLPSASAPDNAAVEAVEACPAIDNGVCGLAKAFRGTCASNNASQCCPVCQELIMKGRSSEGDCMDPSTDDVESMKCECLSGFQNCEIQYGGDDNEAKRVCCLHKFFCNWDDTCEDWKEEFCPVQFCPAEAGTEAVGSMRRLSAEEVEADTSNTKLEDSFDFSGWDTQPKNRRSLGKCSDMCWGSEDCRDEAERVPRRRRGVKCAYGKACCPLEYANPWTPTVSYGKRQTPYDPTILGKDYQNPPCARWSYTITYPAILNEPSKTNHGYRRLNGAEMARLNTCTKLNACEQLKLQIKTYEQIEADAKAAGGDYISSGVYTPEQLETIRLQEIEDHKEEARLIKVKQAQVLAWKDGGCR